eukprot:15458843-Alexandrium_andersonii.AAC.1
MYVPRACFRAWATRGKDVPPPPPAGVAAKATAVLRTMAPALRRALREDKAAWVGKIAQEAASAAGRADQRSLYQ